MGGRERHSEGDRGREGDTWREKGTPRALQKTSPDCRLTGVQRYLFLLIGLNLYSVNLAHNLQEANSAKIQPP